MHPDKTEPTARRGRRATGLPEREGKMAEPPKGDFEAARLFCCLRRVALKGGFFKGLPSI